MFETVHLQTHFATVQANFNTLRDKFDDLATANENLLMDLNCVKVKWLNTLAYKFTITNVEYSAQVCGETSHDKNVNGLTNIVGPYMPI